MKKMEKSRKMERGACAPHMTMKIIYTYEGVHLLIQGVGERKKTKEEGEK